MRYIARAPVTVAGRDRRPGDSFEVEPDADLEAMLASEEVEAIPDEPAAEAAPAAVTEAAKPARKGKK